MSRSLLEGSLANGEKKDPPETEEDRILREKAFKKWMDAYEGVTPLVTTVVAAHFAFEVTLDGAIEMLLPNSSRLRGFGFVQKLSLVRALMPDEKAAKALDLFEIVNEIRNHAAHRNSKATVDGLVAKFLSQADSDFPTDSKLRNVEKKFRGRVQYIGGYFNARVAVMYKNSKLNYAKVADKNHRPPLDDTRNVPGKTP